jgi:hypothetical protein
LTFPYFTRPNKPATYQYDLPQLEAALISGGLTKVGSVSGGPVLGLRDWVRVKMLACGFIGAVLGVIATLAAQQCFGIK